MCSGCFTGDFCLFFNIQNHYKKDVNDFDDLNSLFRTRDIHLSLLQVFWCIWELIFHPQKSIYVYIYKPSA